MSLDRDVEILARIPALAGFEPDALRLLAFVARRAAYQPGEQLYDTGDRADGAIAILSGGVAIVDVSAPDQKSLVSTGALIDEMAMYVATERVGRATATEPTSVFELTREMIKRVLVEFPGSAERVRDVLSGRLNHLSGEIGQVGRRLAALDADPE